MRQTALNMVYELAKRDPRVVFIGSDLGAGTLQMFKTEMPDRFFMEGICEANVVGMAAGLALGGKIPFINTIATFLTRRCFEQIVLDLCLHDLPVRLLGSGGGLVYAPLGPTHLAVEDIGILRPVPNIALVAPADALEMRKLMAQTLDWRGPLYIRFGKGNDPLVTDADTPMRIGKANVMRSGDDALVVTTGIALRLALEAAAALAGQGLECTVLHCHTIKPLDREAILSHAARMPSVVTVEEHVLTGGLGTAVAEILAEAGLNPARRFRRVALPDAFPHRYGNQASLMGDLGVTAEKVAAAVRELAAS
ncbi:MAG: transketolase C-terminal domain-containing protein [Elusimicrobia bacterium]|nr:transketolase C-terminal domain-containing protein [Elusimicrobiota bacterium]